MGHTLTLLTAALLVGQTQTTDANGKNCNCKKGNAGPVVAQPEFYNDTQRVGWFGWRTSSSSSTNSSGATTTTTRTETWRNGSGDSDGSWTENRPVLSRIRGWFGRGDSPTIKTETTTTPPGTTVTQPLPLVNDIPYRRLPTNAEPPLNNPPAQAPQSPTTQPAVPPIKNRETAPPLPKIDNSLSIDIEPIEFRPAGQPKGSAPTVVPAAKVEDVKAPEVITTSKPSRPNPINARFANKVGQPGDYTWITGQLEIRGNTVVIHYATPETIDRFNGSIAVVGDVDLRSFHNGDLVSVHGSVVQPAGRAPAYRITSVDLIER